MYANKKNLAALFGVTTQTVQRRVKGMEWWDVTKKVGYSQREVYRTHSIALRKLEIPKSWQ